MSTLGSPSDDLPEVLATGRGDTTALVVSMSARHPEGRDAEYLEWHALDHRPEQHRLAGLRGSLRVASTPACRAARAAGAAPYDDVDHVVAYLLTGRDVLGPWRALGKALREGGRMPIRLPSVEVAAFDVVERAAARRVRAGADVIAWRPARGAYLLLEEGHEPAAGLTEVEGVAGVWSARDEQRQLAWCFLDDDAPTVAERVRPVLEARWAGGVAPLLAAPFVTVAAFEWERSLP